MSVKFIEDGPFPEFARKHLERGGWKPTGDDPWKWFNKEGKVQKIFIADGQVHAWRNEAVWVDASDLHEIE